MGAPATARAGPVRSSRCAALRYDRPGTTIGHDTMHEGGLSLKKINAVTLYLWRPPNAISDMQRSIVGGPLQDFHAAGVK